LRKHNRFQFTPKKTCLPAGRWYGNKTIPNVAHTKFHGLTVDHILSWRNHNDLLTNKLSTACYVLRSNKTYMSHSPLTMVYYSLFHSIMTYKIIFWGSSSHNQKIFKIQRTVIRIIMGHSSTDSHSNLYKNWEILPLKSRGYLFTPFICCK
jgi:hypothetical protein